jgi:hypothetical protein
MPPSIDASSLKTEIKNTLDIFIGTDKLQSFSSLQAVNEYPSARMNEDQDSGKKKK